MSTEYDETMATQAQAAPETAQPPAKRVGLLARLFGRGKAQDAEGRATDVVATYPAEKGVASGSACAVSRENSENVSTAAAPAAAAKPETVSTAAATNGCDRGTGTSVTFAEQAREPGSTARECDSGPVPLSRPAKCDSEPIPSVTCAATGMPYLNQSRESLLQELAGFGRTTLEA